MFDIILQGVVFNTAMNAVLGPQNTLILNQGIRRQYHWMSACFCALSDTFLICLGVFGGSLLLNSSPLLLKWVTWGGVAFLFCYGCGAFKAALCSDRALDNARVTAQNRWKMLLLLLMVTWLNPHAWLDAVVILGSVAGQLLPAARPWFAFGAVLASVVWFFVLASLAASLAPMLSRPQAQRIIHILVAVIMWGIAFQLARHRYDVFME